MTVDLDGAHSATGLREAVDNRLAQLRRQQAEGEAALADLDAQREQLVANLLRISGAVQVLAELTKASVE